MIGSENLEVFRREVFVGRCYVKKLYLEILQIFFTEHLLVTVSVCNSPKTAKLFLANFKL